MDPRLHEYLLKHYIIDARPGGIIELTPSVVRLRGFGGEIIQEVTRNCPYIINGKSVWDLTFEEFLEWESLHRVEGEGGLDQGEGGDGGHGDILGGEGRVEGGEPDLVSIVRLLDVLDGRVGVPV